jgi:hypothetical protein
MKCIKSIKELKQIKLGLIRRINDKEAESDVKSGYWMYIPKSEWKTYNKESKNNSKIESVEKTKVIKPKKTFNEKNNFVNITST